jgi:hypothetical protein
MEKVFMKPASKVLIHIAKNGKEGLAVIWPQIVNGSLYLNIHCSTHAKNDIKSCGLGKSMQRPYYQYYSFICIVARTECLTQWFPVRFSRVNGWILKQYRCLLFMNISDVCFMNALYFIQYGLILSETNGYIRVY